MNAQPLKKGMVRRFFVALQELRMQPLNLFDANRVKIALGVLLPIAEPILRDVQEQAKKFGTPNAKGGINFPADGLKQFEDAVNPMLNDTVDVPAIKGLSVERLRDVQITADSLDVLIETGFLTGDIEKTLASEAS